MQRLFENLSLQPLLGQAKETDMADEFSDFVILDLSESSENNNNNDNNNNDNNNNNNNESNVEKKTADEDKTDGRSKSEGMTENNDSNFNITTKGMEYLNHSFTHLSSLQSRIETRFSTCTTALPSHNEMKEVTKTLAAAQTAINTALAQLHHPCVEKQPSYANMTKKAARAALAALGIISRGFFLARTSLLSTDPKKYTTAFEVFAISNAVSYATRSANKTFEALQPSLRIGYAEDTCAMAMHYVQVAVSSVYTAGTAVADFCEKVTFCHASCLNDYFLGEKTASEYRHDRTKSSKVYIDIYSMFMGRQDCVLRASASDSNAMAVVVPDRITLPVIMASISIGSPDSTQHAAFSKTSRSNNEVDMLELEPAETGLATKFHGSQLAKDCLKAYFDALERAW